MTTQHDVDALEQTGANVISLGANQLLGHAGIELQGARQLVLLHHLLEHDCSGDVDGQSRIVPFAVARSALYYRIMISNPWSLRRSRNAIDVADKANDWFSRTP